MMNLKYSRDTILFLLPFLKIASVLGIAPFYDFRKKEVLYEKFHRVYAILHIVCYIAALAFALYVRVSEGLNKDQVSLQIVGHILVISFHVTSVSFPVLKIDQWKNLFFRMAFLESKPYLNTRGSLETKFLRNPIFQNAIWMFFFTLGYVYYVYLWIFANPQLITYVAPFLYIFALEFIMGLVVHNTALAIRCKFEDINRFLVGSTTFPEPKMVEVINRVGKMYIMMLKIVDTFNSLFGWPILFLLLHTSSAILVTLSNLGDPNDIYSTVLEMVVTIIALFGAVSIPLCCDKARRESENLLLTCMDLREYAAATSTEYQALSKLAELLTRQKIIFCAANFFEIKRSTIFAFLSNTATYLVVFLQFKMSSTQ